MEPLIVEFQHEERLCPVRCFRKVKKVVLSQVLQRIHSMHRNMEEITIPAVPWATGSSCTSFLVHHCTVVEGFTERQWN